MNQMVMEILLTHPMAVTTITTTTNCHPISSINHLHFYPTIDHSINVTVIWAIKIHHIEIHLICHRRDGVNDFGQIIIEIFRIQCVHRICRYVVKQKRKKEKKNEIIYENFSEVMSISDWQLYTVSVVQTLGVGSGLQD